MSMETFTERLDRLLKENRITQTELAEIVGIRRPTISDWKKNGSYPTADVAVKIAAALHTTVEFLVTGETHNPDSDTLAAVRSEVRKLNDLLK